MLDFLDSAAFFSVLLTFLAFSAGLLLQKKWNSPLLSPILIGAIIVIVFLKLFQIPNEVYQRGCSILSFLLTPATICFSIAFYQQLQKLKKHIFAITLGVLGGTLCGLGFIYLMCQLFSLDWSVTASLLPKSVTNAIGVVLSEQMGGITSVTTAAIMITGTFGHIIGPAVCKLFQIKDPIAQGVAYGTSAHIIGTSKANEISQLCGAASTLSLTVAGIVTSVVLSFVTGV